MICVEEVTSLEISPHEWNELVEASLRPSVFLTYEWISTWWEYFRPRGAELKCLAVRDNEKRLAGLLPLIAIANKGLRNSHKTYCSLTNRQSPRSDFIVRADRAKESFQTLSEYLLDESSWSRLELKKVPDLPQTTMPWLKDLERGGCRYLVRLGPQSPYLPVEADWDSYYQGLSKKFRGNTDRAQRNLEKKGSLEFKEIRNSPDLDAHLDAAFALEAAGWKGEAGVAVTLSEEWTSFYRTIAHLAAQNDWFRLYILSFDGRPIAFSYCLHYRDRVSLVRIGYDPEYSKESPGAVLQKLLIQHLFHQPDVSVYDMLEGVGNWKTRWTDKIEQGYTLLLYPPGFTGRTSYWLKAGWLGSRDYIKKTPLHDLYQRWALGRGQGKRA